MEKGERERVLPLLRSMLRLAALAATRRGGSTRRAWLTVDQIKSGLAKRESAAMTAAAAAAMASSSSLSSSSFSLSVRSFAARAAPAEGGDDRKAATRNAVLVKVREFQYNESDFVSQYEESVSHLDLLTTSLSLKKKKKIRP